MESEKGVGSKDGPAEFRLVLLEVPFAGDAERALSGGCAGEAERVLLVTVLRLRALVVCVMVGWFIFC